MRGENIRALLSFISLLLLLLLLQPSLWYA